MDGPAAAGVLPHGHDGRRRVPAAGQRRHEAPPAALCHLPPHRRAEAGRAPGLSGPGRRRVPPPGGEGREPDAGKGPLG